MSVSKTIKSIVKNSILIGFTSILTGCFNSVFSSVKTEVLLEDASISGFVNSIVRYTDTEGKEYLFLQNGQIYRKQISEDDDYSKLTKNAASKCWGDPVKNAPEAQHYDYDNQVYRGYHVYKLASDENYIYALAYQSTFYDEKSRNVPSVIKLFVCDGIDNEWKEVSAVNDAIADYISHLDKNMYMMDSSIHLFCTNTPQKAHRKAYIRIGGGNAKTSSSSTEEQKAPNYEENYGNRTYGNYGILTLNGEGTSTDSSNTIPAGTNNAGYKSLSVCYYNGDVHFFNYLASATNETKNKDASWVYYGTDEKYLESFPVSDPSEIQKTSSTATGSIISIAVTNNAIILGTNESGANKVNLTTIDDESTTEIDEKGKPDSNISGYSTANGASIMTSPYCVRMLFCTDPSINETDTGSALYSSLQFKYTQSSANADYDNVGLWSYYSDRQNWNRE